MQGGRILSQKNFFLFVPAHTCFHLSPPGVSIRVGSSQATHHQDVNSLPLLPSGPDGVQSSTLWWTQPSWPPDRPFLTGKGLMQGFRPCYSGLQVQGTANSPPECGWHSCNTNPIAPKSSAIPGNVIVIKHNLTVL